MRKRGKSCPCCGARAIPTPCSRVSSATSWRAASPPWRGAKSNPERTQPEETRRLKRCPIRWILTSSPPRKRGPRADARRSPLDSRLRGNDGERFHLLRPCSSGSSLVEQRALALGRRRERLIARDGLDDLVEIPVALRFGRRLHLRQV